MAYRQDPTNERGVANDIDPHHSGYVVSAAERKEDAALGLILARPTVTWSQIAEALGYPTPRSAKAAFERAWARRISNDDKTRAFMRDMAREQLGAVLSPVMTKALNPDHPEHLAAAGRARELIAEQAKLMGLYAPVELAVTTNPTQAEIENWVDSRRAIEAVIEDDIFADAEIIEDDDVSSAG